LVSGFEETKEKKKTETKRKKEKKEKLKFEKRNCRFAVCLD
jgi:hypothetical protein